MIQWSQKIKVRPLRIILDRSLRILGMGLIVGAILLVRSIYSQLAVVLVGLMCIELGVWQLAHRLLPNDRRFHALRRELDAFVECSRQLNQAALAIQINDTPEQRAAFDDLRRALHQSVDGIAEVVGKRQEDLPRASRGASPARDRGAKHVGRTGARAAPSHIYGAHC
jgi:hypothetical protein